jgi:CheY-like chemotaxis protein
MNYLPRHGADGAVNGFYIFVIDETERKQTEEALRNLNETLEERVSARTRQLAEANELLNEMFERERAEEALRHAQKMEAVGQLTGGIAHDFNNMLTGIIGSLDLMQRYIADGRTAEIARFTEAAVSSARAAALTHRLLAFSRRQSLDRKPLNPNDLIRSLEDLFRRTKGDHIAQTAPGQRRLDGQHRRQPAGKRPAQSGDQRPGRHARWWRVMHRNRQRLPRRQRHHHPGTGQGRGLPDARRQRQRHGHDTEDPGQGLRSVLHHQTHRPGHRPGSVDDLWFRPAVRRPCDPVQHAWPGHQRALYLPRLHGVEPQDVYRRSSRRPRPLPVKPWSWSKTTRPYACWCSTCSRSWAITYDRRREGACPCWNRTAVDLLVTDVGLPGMNGRQLAEIARQHRPELKVLFMTGYAEKAAERQGFLEDGMDMVAKPFSIDLLANKIRTMIGQPQ